MGVDSADEMYFDAVEVASSPRRATMITRRRLSTDFPEQEPSQALGPWRATQVEGCGGSECETLSDSWLLVGRRHSVDERRDAMEQGKALFLRILEERADGRWRSRTAARAAELEKLEEEINSQLTRQTSALQATYGFWYGRHAADKAYLAHLDSCTSGGKGALPAQQAHVEAQWRTHIQSAEGRSSAWAGDLPNRIEEHTHIQTQVRRAVTRAMEDVHAVCRLVLAARGAVWPVASLKGTTLPPGRHSADAGPEGMCLWQAVRCYLTACDKLQKAQEVALAQVFRQQCRSERLGKWVDDVLSRGSENSASPLSPMSPPDLDFVSKPQIGTQPIGSETDDSDDESCSLDLSMDISALVVHEQQIELRFSMDDKCSWVPSKSLLSVDLWLHIWSSEHYSQESTPEQSIPLARACLRPVVECYENEARILQLCFRPQKPQGFLTNFSTRLFWGSDPEVIPEALYIRCTSATAATEFMSALELVEKLYPIVV